MIGGTNLHIEYSPQSDFGSPDSSIDSFDLALMKNDGKFTFTNKLSCPYVDVEMVPALSKMSLIPMLDSSYELTVQLNYLS